MLTRLRAEERLARINDAALSAGNLTEDAAARSIQRLEEQASGQRRRAAKATPAGLAAMGIGVVSSSGCEALPEAEPVGGQDATSEPSEAAVSDG